MTSPRKLALFACSFAVVVLSASLVFAQCGANGTQACGSPSASAQSNVVPPPNFAPALDNNVIGPVQQTQVAPAFAPVAQLAYYQAPAASAATAAGSAASSASSSTAAPVAAVGAPVAVGTQLMYAVPVQTTYQAQAPVAAVATYQVPVATQTFAAQVAAPVAAPAAVATVATETVAAIPTNVAVPAVTVAANNSCSSCNKGKLLGGRRSVSRSSSKSVSRG